MNFQTPPLEVKKGINAKLYNPEKTFFFERPDGSIFSTNEAEAWVVWTGKNQTIGLRTIPPKLIGTSDGKIFNDAVREAKTIAKEKGIDEAQEHIRFAYELELEEARKHPEKPRNHSAIGLNGQPVGIDGLPL